MKKQKLKSVTSNIDAIETKVEQIEITTQPKVKRNLLTIATPKKSIQMI